MYDGERGEGKAAAERYGVTGYPTLLVLDAQGNVLLRGGYPGADALGAWLERAAGAATAKGVEASLKKNPRDLGLLWHMAQRARSTGDEAGERRWLRRIVSADRAAGKPDAARASWRLAELSVTQRLGAQARAAALKQIRTYPASGEQALAVLAAAGASVKELESAYAKVIAATSDPSTLNRLIYTALGAGAHDAALAAAEKQVSLNPDDPNSYDSLAEVHNYRGDRDKAVATVKTGLGKKGPPQILAIMRENMRRFERGGPSPDVREAGSFDRVLESRFLFSSARPSDPESVTRRMLESEKHALSSACAGLAGRLESALLRVTIGASARVSRVEVLEPGAGARLKKCLIDAARRLPIPADNPEARVVIDVPLEAAR